MKNFKFLVLIGIGILVFSVSRCKEDVYKIAPDPKQVGTPYEFEIPEGFPMPFIPADNPMTVEGVELGRHLFYDKRLSRDLSMSCGSCHTQFYAMSDNKPRSTGIHGHQTRRNSMPIFNLAWQEKFFWDGRAVSLEEQALLPVTDQLELDNDWPTVESRLQADTLYPQMFSQAFGDDKITKERVAKAIAQFERSIVSADSEFDKVVRLGTKNKFDIDITTGGDPNRALVNFNNERFDCFHCHGIKETSYLLGAYGRDLQFLNNGLKTEEEQLVDRGREEVTGNRRDRGKFKLPSLRNVTYSLPLMHDGSIPHLDSLVQFYKFGGHLTVTTDPNMEAAGEGRDWTQQEVYDLIALLKSMTDYGYLENPAYSNPFEQ